MGVMKRVINEICSQLCPAVPRGFVNFHGPRIFLWVSKGSPQILRGYMDVKICDMLGFDLF